MVTWELNPETIDKYRNGDRPFSEAANCFNYGIIIIQGDKGTHPSMLA